MRGLIGIVAAIALFPSNAAAQRLIELDPDSPWVVNYDDDSCALLRQFGVPGEHAFLEVRQFGDGQEFQFAVTSKDFRRKPGDIKVALRPIEAEPRDISGFEFRLNSEQEGKLFSYRMWPSDAYRDFVEKTSIINEQQRGIVLGALDAINKNNVSEARLYLLNTGYQEASRSITEAFLKDDTWQPARDRMEREVQSLFVGGAFDKDILLRTGELHTPMQAMRACVDELYPHWGIDVEAHRSLSRRASPLDLADLQRRVSAHYPARMVRAGMQGYLRVRLSVSADGVPTACHMQTPFNNKAFEQTACDALMKHASFQPALDKDGQPIASFYQTAISYMLTVR
jgi:TonB family protein